MSVNDAERLKEAITNRTEALELLEEAEKYCKEDIEDFERLTTTNREPVNFYEREKRKLKAIQSAKEIIKRKIIR